MQKYIVHQIRNSIRYVSYKDVKKITSALKPISKASSEEAAQEEFSQFKKVWSKKYPLIIRILAAEPGGDRHFFQIPAGNQIIYTTNIIESYHRQLRKVTKGKSLFPSDEALLKMLYLATQDVLQK